jgi:hypothetical protein
VLRAQTIEAPGIPCGNPLTLPAVVLNTIVIEIQPNDDLAKSQRWVFAYVAVANAFLYALVVSSSLDCIGMLASVSDQIAGNPAELKMEITP